MSNQLQLPHFAEEDFFTEGPLEYIYSLKKEKGQTEAELAKNLLLKQARKAGVSNFKSLYEAYEKEARQKNEVIASNHTLFKRQPICLNCGTWEADDSGVYCYDKLGYRVQACSHPIMPVRRIRNIDTGEVKIEIAFRRGGKPWQRMIVDKKVLASNTAILDLATYEVGVTSENARLIVSYLSDLESLNYDQLEEVESTSRMGWVQDGVFAPYSDKIIFDGEASFCPIYNSITSKGDFNTWIDLCRKVRKRSVYARIVLASSFASVLIKDCKLLPFFVHMWGGAGSGKTVSLMLAASVWGNPEIGKYPQTFNSTHVAQEMLAGFVNNMPLIMDELQVIKDRLSFDEMIYKLTEGAGKNRGKKNGGIKETQTWRNCVLTTGEYPIVNDHSGAGAVNRIIEIDCKNISFFENPKHIVDVITENYGFAGRKFVEYLMKGEKMEKAKALQKKYYEELERLNSTSKQASSASVILAADELVTGLIFKDGKNLKVEDFEPLLVSTFKASQNERAYEYICDSIDINQNKFEKRGLEVTIGEVWGLIEDDIVYIIKSKFDKILEDGGFNSKSFMSWGIENKKIMATSAQTKTIVKRIGGNPCRCMAIIREGEKKPVKNAEFVSTPDVVSIPTPEEKDDVFADFDFTDEYEI